MRKYARVVGRYGPNAPRVFLAAKVFPEAYVADGFCIEDVEASNWADNVSWWVSNKLESLENKSGILFLDS